LKKQRKKSRSYKAKVIEHNEGLTLPNAAGNSSRRPDPNRKD